MVPARTYAAALTLLLALISPRAYPGAPSSASAIRQFTHAQAEARRTHRNILVVFSASWCGPCKLFHQYLEDPRMKRITEKAFVVQPITMDEFAPRLLNLNSPGAAELRTSLGAVGNPGLPFLVITTADGVPIVNSYAHGDPHQNTGGPADAIGLEWYMEMLKRGAPSLTAADRAAIERWIHTHSIAFKSILPVEPFHVP